MLFPHTKAFFDHDKKIVKKVNLELDFVFWQEKTNKIYNIDGPEGS